MADLTGLMPDTGENPWDLRPAIQAVNADTESRLKTADAAELIRDTIGTALVEGTGIEIVVDDTANTITIGSDGSIDNEVLYEELKSVLVEGTGIDISFNDTTKKITITATGGGGGAPEDHTHEIEDITGLQSALDNKAGINEVGVTSVTAGPGIAVDDTDPAAPVVSLITPFVNVLLCAFWHEDTEEWDPRPESDLPVLYVSTQDAAAPDPEDMVIGDIRIYHPGAE